MEQKIKKYFKDKIILITGGTGSFGNEMIKQLIDTNIKEIRIFSRDELKQDDMRKLYNDTRLKFYIGDIRDLKSCENCIKDCDLVFHAAALKQVPSCEFYPLEAVKTNIIGTENILEASINANVSKVICLSTDKAVYPVNAMGMTKGLMEKIMIAKSRISSKTVICGTRYGNVIASRGSVIPLFINQIKNNLPVTITDPNMTRFMMSLQDAVNLVLFAFENGQPGEIYIHKAPSATIDTVVESLKDILNKKNLIKEVIGTRHGEKLYEVLLSREESFSALDLGMFYKILPDNRNLDYGLYFEKGQININDINEFNSHNANILDKKNLNEMFILNEDLKLIL